MEAQQTGELDVLCKHDAILLHVLRLRGFDTLVFILSTSAPMVKKNTESCKIKTSLSICNLLCDFNMAKDLNPGPPV